MQTNQFRPTLQPPPLLHLVPLFPCPNHPNDRYGQLGTAPIAQRLLKLFKPGNPKSVYLGLLILRKEITIKAHAHIPHSRTPISLPDQHQYFFHVPSSYEMECPSPLGISEYNKLSFL